MAHTGEHDELQDAPLLRSIAPHEPFVVPDGFFERFPHRVQARVTGRRSASKRSLAIRWALGMAAAAGIAAVVWSLWPAVPAPALTADVPPTFEHDVLLLDEVDADLILEAIPEGGTSLAEVDPPMDADELMAYLENEDIPMDLLIEEL